jgi:ketosteroid isomerase-like protein
MTGLEKTVARDEIRQLVYRYAHATDMRDLELLVACFVPNVQVGRDSFGRDALRANFERQLRDVGITILFVGNHRIDFQDTTHATGNVYCKGEIQDGKRWIHQAIRYDDTYERVGDEWLLVRRKHLLWYGAEPGQNPLELAPANWPANHSGSGTLPESEESWRTFWSSDEDNAS